MRTDPAGRICRQSTGLWAAQATNVHTASTTTSGKPSDFRREKRLVPTIWAPGPGAAVESPRQFAAGNSSPRSSPAREFATEYTNLESIRLQRFDRELCLIKWTAASQDPPPSSELRRADNRARLLDPQFAAFGTISFAPECLTGQGNRQGNDDVTEAHDELDPKGWDSPPWSADSGTAAAVLPVAEIAPSAQRPTPAVHDYRAPAAWRSFLHRGGTPSGPSPGAYEPRLASSA